MRKILIFLLIFFPISTLEVSQDSPKNHGKSEKLGIYATVTLASDNITEISGNDINTGDVELIEGNYNGNVTKARTARRYYGGWGRRRYYGGWGGWGRRRYYSYYSPRRYYYGGYYGGYGYGYGYYSYYYKAK